MRKKVLVIGILALMFFFLTSAEAKSKKPPPPRGMIEGMQALPCGVKQKGLNGLGAVWGSIGVTSVSSNEKLCPEYLVRTDELEYHIRPRDTKHPVILPIGHEAELKVQKDKMLLKVPDGDKKTHEYTVVSMEPVKSARGENAGYRPTAAQPATGRAVPEPPPATPTEKLPPRVANQSQYPLDQSPPPPQ